MELKPTNSAEQRKQVTHKKQSRDIIYVRYKLLKRYYAIFSDKSTGSAGIREGASTLTVLLFI